MEFIHNRYVYREKGKNRNVKRTEAISHELTNYRKEGKSQTISHGNSRCNRINITEKEDLEI